MSQRRVKAGTSAGGQFAPDISGKTPAPHGPVVNASMPIPAGEPSYDISAVSTAYKATRRLTEQAKLSDALYQHSGHEIGATVDGDLGEEGKGSLMVGCGTCDNTVIYQYSGSMQECDELFNAGWEDISERYERMFPEGQEEANELTERIRKALPSCDNLRKPAYRGNHIPSAGHCYIVSELLYHALGGKDAGWTPQTLRHEDSPHWFLRHTDGTILDPTADQFRTPVPYEKARGIGFLTKQPSKRCQRLAEIAGVPLLRS